jgi:NadR type nicotinamide-nucleotide adenylyltransferase
MDKLFVLIYDSPQATNIPLNVRANWIKHLYPQVEVIEGWNGPNDEGYTQDVIDIQNEYVTKMTLGKGITHFYSSESYGDHISKALDAVNRTIDIERTNVKICASNIQNEPLKYRDFVDPFVYKDLVTNIVFMGAPSTGKTTIAERMAKEFDTAWMPEYGREYWDEHQIDMRLTPEQLLEIAEGHIEREDKAIQTANKYLFTDTNAITTYMFAVDYHGWAMGKLTQMAIDVEKRYDLVFLCEDDIPYDDTWDREGDEHRHRFHRQIIADLTERKIPYIPLKGTLDERVEKIKEILQRYEKYKSLGEMIG